MNEPRGVRLALALQVRGRRSAAAAIQIVILLLAEGARVELDLLHATVPGPTPTPAKEFQGNLLAAATFAQASPDDATRFYWENWLRPRVERAYARLGITDYRYDLQVL